MSSRFIAATTLTLLCGLAAAPPLLAQTAGVGVSTGLFHPSGDDFAETEWGPGIDVVLRLAWDRLDLGIGGQWNHNGVPFSEDDWSTMSVYAESRYRWSAPERTVSPFVAGRFGRLTQSVLVTEGERTAAGWGGGLLVGLAIELQSRAALELGLPLYRVGFGDYEIDDRRFAGTESRGWLSGLVVGVTFTFRPDSER